VQRWLSIILSTAFSLAALFTLYDLESRRSLIIEGSGAALLVFFIAGTWRLAKRQSILPLGARLVHVLALLTLLAFAAESAGYANRAMTLLARLTYLGFCLYIAFSPEDENRGFTILLSGVLLPFVAGFFAWNGYLLAALWLLYAMTVLVREKLPRSISPGSLDFLLFFFVLFFAAAPLWAVNVQDAMARNAHQIVGLTILILAVRYPDFFRNRLAQIGCIYVAFYILVHIAGTLGIEGGYRVSKDLKGQLITTQLAQHFMFFTPAFLILTGPRKKQSLILALLSLVALFLTVARGSLLGFLCGMAAALAVAVLLHARTKRQRILTGLGGLLFFALIALAIILLRSRIEYYFQTWTMEQRLALWHMTFQSWLSYPLAGNGTFIAFNIFTTTASPAFADLVQEHAPLVAPWIEPHNLYLALLLSGGIIGLCSFLFIMGYIIVRSLRAPNDTSLLLIALTVSFLVVGLTESLISTYIPLFLLWILWALARTDLRGPPRLRLPIPPLAWTLALLSVGLAGTLYFTGNYFIHRSQIALGRIQTSVRGLPLLEQPAGARLQSDVERAQSFAPLDWRTWQMSGEVAFASGRRTRDKKILVQAMEHYEKASILNGNSPLLHLRRSEIAGTLKEMDPSFSVEEDDARRLAAAMDPYGVFTRYWRK